MSPKHTQHTCSETIITLTQGYRLHHMSKVDNTYLKWITQGSVAVIRAIPLDKSQNYADVIQRHLETVKSKKQGHCTHKSINHRCIIIHVTIEHNVGLPANTDGGRYTEQWKYGPEKQTKKEISQVNIPPTHSTCPANVTQL